MPKAAVCEALEGGYLEAMQHMLSWHMHRLATEHGAQQFEHEGMANYELDMKYGNDHKAEHNGLEDET
eukprot:3863999-Alexandrium_andersonii.AAC.1